MQRITPAIIVALAFTACAAPDDDLATEETETTQTVRATTASLDAQGLLASLVRQSNLYGIDRPLRASRYQTPLHQPQATPDGIGAFQYFSGADGLGAIYAWQQENGAYQTHLVYGAILDLWARYGWEAGLGYPRGSEEAAKDWSPDTPCLSEGGVRQQLFGTVSWNDDRRDFVSAADVVLCWAPDRGTWVLPAALADALERGIPVTSVRL